MLSQENTGDNVKLSDSDRVFDNKEDVLKFVKVNKGARFRAFETREEAEDFAKIQIKVNQLIH